MPGKLKKVPGNIIKRFKLRRIREDEEDDYWESIDLNNKIKHNKSLPKKNEIKSNTIETSSNTNEQLTHENIDITMNENITISLNDNNLNNNVNIVKKSKRSAYEQTLLLLEQSNKNNIKCSKKKKVKVSY